MTEATTTTAIKTVSMPLCIDSEVVDTAELDRMFAEFRIVYDETAKRMPSLPKYMIKRRVGDPYNHWYQEFRSRSDIDLPAQTTLEAVMKAREAYASMHSNKNYDGIPHGKGNVVRFHNQQITITKSETDDQYLLSIPTRAGWGGRITIPFVRNRYSYHILDAMMNGLKHGASELVRYGDTYWFNLTVKWEIKVQRGETPIGIDFGMKNIAVACALDNGHPKIRLWSGKEARHKLREYLKLIRAYQQKGLLRKVKSKKRLYRNFMKTKNHQVSRDIIKFAQQFKYPFIVLEDLPKFRKQADWTFAELRTFIEYKALHAGISVVAVDAKYTSQQCNKCNHTSKENRPNGGIIFSCCDCGYTVNADVNASINLAHKEIIRK